jgi:hypothetical protein
MKRSRLVPKVVFGVVASASAIPALACHHEDDSQFRGVAAPAYTATATTPDPNECPSGQVRVASGADGGFACLAMGVAATAYPNPPVVPTRDGGK